MTIEHKIQLCGAEWTIKEVTQRTLVRKRGGTNREALDGLCDLDKQTIYVDHSLDFHRKAVKIVHELLHVCYDRSGYCETDEEDNVAALEHGVYEMIMNFPEAYKRG